MLEIIIAGVAGIIAGCCTGLFPGVHINLVATLVWSLSSWLLGFFSPFALAVFLLVMSVTHCFLDVIPSVFLNVPDVDRVLSVLPSQKLLLSGFGFKAVSLSVIGGLSSLILLIVVAPLLSDGIAFLFPLVKPYIGWLLLLISLWLIIREGSSWLSALLVFLFAGILGITVFSFASLQEPLFPLFSGLFGVSSLVLSLKQQVAVPVQVRSFTLFGKLKTVWLSVVAVVASTLCSFLPGLGGAQASVIASGLTKNASADDFLVVSGGINVVNMVLSLITLFVFEKARNGSLAVMSRFVTVGQQELVLLLGIALVAGVIAAGLALLMGWWCACWVQKINYGVLCKIVLGLIIFLVFVICGWRGLLVLITSSLFGLVVLQLPISKSHVMGCLLLPVMGFYLL
ncbi:MAG: tripartite tricarboxylate transporter permease [Nanoarchaeota archaeon]|nr:tripartite tricarboxylate transporter permease [Nanoarchaeota archaeon]